MINEEEELYKHLIHPELRIIDELEKIKTELSDNSYYDNITGQVKFVSWEDIKTIFDKHIAELKGE